MKKYKKIYLDHFGYGQQDYVPSEVSGAQASDIHHICFRSHCGLDEIENLIALTREEHIRAHADPAYNEMLKEVHKNKLKGI